MAFPCITSGNTNDMAFVVGNFTKKLKFFKTYLLQQIHFILICQMDIISALLLLHYWAINYNGEK